MMYNPYNWKVEKKETPKCIIDELCHVSAELELARMEMEFIEEKIINLETQKISLVKRLVD